MKKQLYPTALLRLHVRLRDLGQADPDLLLKIDIPVLRLTVTVNHWNEADTIDATVDYEDFPIDPRIVRAMTVEAFLADRGGPEPLFWEKQSPEAMESHAIFTGIVDEVETELDSEEGRSARIRGRDYTAYYLDTSMSTEPVRWVKDGRKRSLLEILEDLAHRIGTKRETRVETQALPIVPAPGVQPKKIIPADYKRYGTDPDLGKRNTKRGESVWEAMQEIAMEAGLILYLDLDDIVLRQPHTIFLDEGMDPSTFYRWVLGENVSNFKPSLDMGRQQGLNVRVVSYIPEAQETLIATAPQDPVASRKSLIPASRLLFDEARGGAELTEEERRDLRESPREAPEDRENHRGPNYEQHTVNGITSQAQLQRIADELYELHRYHDLEVELRTSDMADSDGRSALALRFGAPVALDATEGFRSILAFSVTEQIARLIALGYPREAAEAIATAHDRLTVPFYVHQVRHTFNAEDGGGYELQVIARSRKQVELGEVTAKATVERIEGGTR